MLEEQQRSAPAQSHKSESLGENGDDAVIVGELKGGQRLLTAVEEERTVKNFVFLQSLQYD